MIRSGSFLETVFLDRDGVINRKLPEGKYVTSWEHFELLPGVSEAIAELNQAGLRVLAVTNQRGVALGLYSEEDVRRIHSQLDETLARAGARIQAYYFCPHDRFECTCRKPLPGLFQQAQRDFPGITPESSLMIGDSLSDIQFGQNLGLKTIFIAGDEENQKPGTGKAANFADQTFTDLPRAVHSLVSGLRRQR